MSFHPMVAERQLKPQMVEWASRLTVIGLVFVLCWFVLPAWARRDSARPDGP